MTVLVNIGLLWFAINNYKQFPKPYKVTCKNNIFFRGTKYEKSTL